MGHVPGLVMRPVLATLAHMTGMGTAVDASSLSEDPHGLSDPLRRAGFLSSARAVLDRHGQALNAAPYLQQLESIPVLLAWGTADRTIPPSQHQTLARTLPTDHWSRSVEPATSRTRRTPTRS